jgi:hypothetical protein
MGNDMFRFNDHQALVRFNLDQRCHQPRIFCIWRVVDINRTIGCHKDKFPQEPMKRYFQNRADDSCDGRLICVRLAKLNQAV